MKRRNCLQQIIGILLCCTLFSSCLDDNEPETFFPTLGTVNADENDITIESDSYGLLIPTNPGFITSTQTDSTGQRILAVFQYTENTTKEGKTGMQVELVRVNKVLTKKADDLRIGIEDVFGNSPIQITAASISQKHLNIQYEYYGSTNISHRISLVLNSETQLDENGNLVRPEVGFKSLIRLVLRKPIPEKQAVKIIWAIGIVCGLIGIIVAIVMPGVLQNQTLANFMQIKEFFYQLG